MTAPPFSLCKGLVVSNRPSLTRFTLRAIEVDGYINVPDERILRGMEWFLFLDLLL